jgi:hypothetical protein
MVSVLASSVVDRGFESRSGQIKFVCIKNICYYVLNLRHLKYHVEVLYHMMEWRKEARQFYFLQFDDDRCYVHLCTFIPLTYDKVLKTNKNYANITESLFL